MDTAETSKVSRQKRGLRHIAHLKETERTPHKSIDTLRPDNVPSLRRSARLYRGIGRWVGRFVVLKDIRYFAKESLFFLSILVGSVCVLSYRTSRGAGLAARR